MNKIEHTLTNYENNSWKLHLEREFTKKYFTKLNLFLNNEFKTKKIFPEYDTILSALNLTSVKNTKVVILGQDPYHGINQANGLCFSVSKGTKIPPSLRNVYKEIESDLGIKMNINGDLKSWANQGVLLLNTVLTVRESEADSHQNQGWEEFTDAVINVINQEKENIVFLLWGSKAKKKAKNIDRNKHYILEAPHPSPLSSYRGFFGCKHFSKTNNYLTQNGRTGIDWEI